MHFFIPKLNLKVPVYNMCYDSAQIAELIYRYAVHAGASEEELEYLRRNWEQKKRKPSTGYYHVSGFDHPELVAFERKQNQLHADTFTWGLIPHWTKDEIQAIEIRNKTLNARGESMFEKPSFRDAAVQKRIVIPLDGFYEHFHKNGKTFPHFIRRKDGESLLVGGLAAEWTNPITGELIQTMAIVTTKANDLMSKIHNNPRMNEPRMPLILDTSNVECWLEGNQTNVEELIRPSDVELESHTVRRLRGKGSAGNTPGAQEEYLYPDLDEPLTLFKF